MSRDEKQEQRWRSLLPVIGDQTEWFDALVQNLFFFEMKGKVLAVEKPVSFAEWVKNTRQDGIVQEELLEKLAAMHKDMMKAADKLLIDVKEVQVKPDFEAFQTFVNIYEEFMQRLRRLERDFLLDGTGYDPFTGLRSPKVLFQDVERELHRLSRRGKHFCIAFGRIDNVERIEQYYTETQRNLFIKAVADLIKLSVRSFDDAYYMGNYEFVLSLKQADMAGGVSALDRLRKELERRNILVKLGTKEIPLSMSCCIAQPVQGDDIRDLLKNLKNDLHSSNRHPDSVLEYYEISPLQRYVQDTAKQ
ncbi:MAG: diguanylate cyclase [Alphaproteobacteria bacterium]|nr:diguanylate cyclase [Alphaproteobacteria bacterium]MBP7763441.1 diguanylate cyclase [Alphaproteobacteria bacterium]MBP7905617.1 diguanylate cyclase [Alphaproteobacteria bacterium]